MYCTKQDLLDRGWEAELIQLTKKTGVVGIDDTALQQAIDDATADINKYIGKFLPLPVGYDGLLRIACDLTRYFLYDKKATDQVQTRYDAAIRFLEKVAKGDISLGVDSNNQPLPEGGLAEIESSPRLFGRDR